jgi:hypothetical protein
MCFSQKDVVELPPTIHNEAELIRHLFGEQVKWEKLPFAQEEFKVEKL